MATSASFSHVPDSFPYAGRIEAFTRPSSPTFAKRWSERRDHSLVGVALTDFDCTFQDINYLYVLLASLTSTALTSEAVSRS